jgi:hypothetical protein
VHDERVEIIGEAAGGGGVVGLLELVDEQLEPLLCVPLVCGFVECLPVAPADSDSRGFSPTPTARSLSICSSISADGGTVRLTA